MSGEVAKVCWAAGMAKELRRTSGEEIDEDIGNRDPRRSLPTIDDRQGSEKGGTTPRTAEFPGFFTARTMMSSEIAFSVLATRPAIPVAAKMKRSVKSIHPWSCPMPTPSCEAQH
jgi:hypothetical protein